MQLINQEHKSLFLKIAFAMHLILMCLHVNIVLFSIANVLLSIL